MKRKLNTNHFSNQPKSNRKIIFSNKKKKKGKIEKNKKKIKSLFQKSGKIYNYFATKIIIKKPTIKKSESIKILTFFFFSP